MNPIQEFMKHDQNQKKEKYAILNQMTVKGQILFTGSSLMEQFPVNELIMNRGLSKVIYNRGIGGFTTDDFLESMEEMVFGPEPSKIFINIGSNDIGSANGEFSLDKLVTNYRTILSQIKERLPETSVYLMAYYPVNPEDKVPDNEWGRTMFITRTNENIALANDAVRQLADAFDYDYINVNAGLTDERGYLKKEYTVEGIHMYANAYQVILENMLPYILE